MKRKVNGFLFIGLKSAGQARGAGPAPCEAALENGRVRKLTSRLSLRGLAATPQTPRPILGASRHPDPPRPPGWGAAAPQTLHLGLRGRQAPELSGAGPQFLDPVREGQAGRQARP